MKALLRFVLVFFMMSPAGLGCSCSPLPPLCQTFYKTPDIFIGTVTVKTALPEQKILGHSYIPGYRYTIHVERVFRGSASGDITLESGSGGGDCGAVFEVGKRYILFTGADTKGTYYTSICSPTAGWSKEYEGEIEAQASLHGKTGRVFGTVLKEPRRGRDASPTPISGVPVIVSNEGYVRHSTTDGKGRYNFEKVPPGDYNVRLELPLQYEADPYAYEDERKKGHEAHVEASGCVESNFWAAVNGRISGRVFDSSGTPLHWEEQYSFNVDLVPVGNFDVMAAYAGSVNKEDGTFEINHVPEGKYLLGVNLFSGAYKEFPYVPTYYPGIENPSAAPAIDLREGEQLSDMDIHLGKPSQALRFDVLVTGEDGISLTKANVINNHAGNDLSHISSEMTNGTGHAILTAFAGEQESVFSWWNCPNSRTQLHSDIITYTSDQAVSAPLHIILHGTCDK